MQAPAVKGKWADLSLVPTSTSAYSILVTLEAVRPQRFIQYKLFYKLSQDLQRLID